jgi:hypothetical protein
MATQRLPVPGADDDQWGTILNGFLRVLHAEDGGIQQWNNDSERPANPDEGETGINLKTGLFEAYQNGQWVELTKDTNCVCPLMVVDSVFTGLVNVDFNLYTTVLARGYWSPADWGGGVFVWDAAATDKPDGGRYFKSAQSATGRWVRKFQDNVNVLHYGAVPDRKFLQGANGNPAYGGVYAIYGSPSAGFTSKPLSAKFGSLTQAQDWYGSVVVSALSNEIDYCAIQATMENNLEVFVPEGAYRCNQPLKMIRKRKLYGVGEQTIIYFDNCSGIVPRQTTPASDLNYVYQDNFYIGFLHLKGSYVSGGAFDDSRSGINFPANPSIPWAYSQSAPAAWLCKIEHITVEYFAGHGVKCLEQFNCAYDFISVQNCGGHGIYIQGGNTTTLRGCYPANCGANYASYRIISGAKLIGCNGNDTPKNWWGSFGGTVEDNGYVAYPNIYLQGCNIEGAEKSIRIMPHGGNGEITFENCYFQAKLTKENPYFIFDEGYQTQITMINNRAFSIGENPVFGTGADRCTILSDPPLKYAAFIKCTSSAAGGRYLFIGRNPDCIYDWLYRAAFFYPNGSPVYGDVVLNIPTVYPQMPYPGLYATSARDLMAKQLFVGTLFETARILSGKGTPQGAVEAPVGSLYLRQDGGTNTTLYVKESGTGNTGWVAK